MTDQERLIELDFILDLIQQLKIHAVREQLFEKAAYLRGRQQEYLEEKELLS